MYIEDYGFISDTETAALVGKDGSIDWLCMPRFDSASCFAKLLGNEENGFWKIAPTEPVKSVRRRYREGTLILETEFETESGVVRLVDYMPIRERLPNVVRVVEGVRGTVPMQLNLVIRFDYGRIIPWVRRSDGELVAMAGPDALILRCGVEIRGLGMRSVAEFSVSEGQRENFVLTWFRSNKSIPKAGQSDISLARTEKFWKDWSGHCCRGQEHQWSEEVKQSLLVLKGLTYAPTGGIIAAATTSLPEELGGVRNWDYRYCWLRDATLTLYALIDAGYRAEAEAWRDWLVRAIAGSPGQMQILYGAAGERSLNEYELPHLDGYEGSKPVRIGNSAVNQFQLDVYGEVLDTLYHARVGGLKAHPWAWSVAQALVNFVTEHWKDADEGIWEVRGGPRHFTHSKIMAWVALDRGVKMVARFGLPGDILRWESIRDEIHREVCARGFNTKLGTFTQSFDDNRLDASLLMIPLVGFLPASDPRVRSTIEAIERDLVVDGFVLRYRTEATGAVDGLPLGEGVFLPCSFWLADCLNLIGRRDEAVELFQQLLSLRNDLGLLSEEYDPRRRRLVGNFPQAFTHVALANTATNLGRPEGMAAKRSWRPTNK